MKIKRTPTDTFVTIKGVEFSYNTGILNGDGPKDTLDFLTKGVYNGANWWSPQEIYIDPIDRTSSAHTRATALLFAAQYAAEGCAALARACRPPLESSGVVVGEIYAWRAWDVLIDKETFWGGTQPKILESLYHNHIWPPGETQYAPNVPDFEEGGFYGFKESGDAWEYAQDFCNRVFISKSAPSRLKRPGRRKPTVLVVLGKVKMWGKIVEHDNGFRGEFAKIHSLDCILDNKSTLGSAFIAAQSFCGIGRQDRYKKLLSRLQEVYGVPGESIVEP